MKKLYWSNKKKKRIENIIIKYKENIKKGKVTTALVRLNAEERREIDFHHTNNNFFLFYFNYFFMFCEYYAKNA